MSEPALLQSLVEAFQLFANFNLWVLIFAGVITGIIIGIIPGIGGIVGLALVIPFLFLMKASEALPFAIALLSVTFTSGAITTILVGVPGTGPNAATLIDGFPMTQKGEGARAVGAAFAASGMGGVLSGVLALGMVFAVIPLIMGLRLGDMTFIILLGLVFMGVLTGRSATKGLISGGLGLLISFIGYQAMTGAGRFTFGTDYLYDGIQLIPFVVGLFAIPPMVHLAVHGGTIAKTSMKYQGIGAVFMGMKDVLHHWKLWLRSSVIGYIIGVIPGVGATTATFIAYGQAKQFSKNRDKFGTGIVEGVIAPESANNGKEGGALLTTLALGIPGSAEMSLLLSIMLASGLVPGPTMLTEHLSLSLHLLMIIIVVNLLAIIICLPLVSTLARVASVPSGILVPIIVILGFFGAFAARSYLIDIGIAIIIGVVGVVMDRFGFSRPAMLLGFVLGFLFEKYLWYGLNIGGPTFFMTPGSLIMIGIIAVVLFLNPMQKLIARRLGR